uniref:Uncharacterized protein n=1 Tax=viral metagenome TaxID=1070528 RepID=A0A6C0ENJ6_9ZZZZ
MVLLGFTKKAAAAPSFIYNTTRNPTIITGIRNPIGKFSSNTKNYNKYC